MNGIGYEFYAGAIYECPADWREEVKIHTYLNVREDAMQLFWIFDERRFKDFKLVIGVSGIGPKGRLSILSQLVG